MGTELTLEDTIEMMGSADYKERFRAEYHQLDIRIGKLQTMLKLWQEGKLDFTPTCPYDTLHTQLVYMQLYRSILEQRAVVEGIEL